MRFWVSMPLLALLAAAAAANMNGDYTISNPNTFSKTQYSTDYTTKNAEYFDVYSPPIETRYGEVYWTMMDPVPLPKELVARFANKTMAVIGYEADQVVKTEDGDKSWPIYYSYNHHFEAYLTGAHSELVKVDATKPGHENDWGMNNHGAPAYYIAKSVNDPQPNHHVPTSQFFSEGNGGEYRKSFHGYPAGFAQLIASPTTFNIQPMQIDTHNRFYNGTGFKAGILPKSSGAPPNASYSGLLECPCTTRIHKVINITYVTISSGSCQVPVKNATECWDAAKTVGAPASATQKEVSEANLPSGCSMETSDKGDVTVYFNSLAQAAPCGSNKIQTGTQGTSDGVSLTLHLDGTSEVGNATITITGPNGVWFGVAFNASAMADLPYSIIVDGNGHVTEQKLGDHDPGKTLANSLTVESVTISGSARIVVLSRPFAGASPDYYSFSNDVDSIPFLTAVGSGPAFAYHKSRAAATLTLSSVDSATCICNGGEKGTINGMPFSKTCAPEPVGDLLEQHNPTCTLESYQGGLSCCHHQNVLLDADQEQPEPVDTIHLKFRFWFQEYDDTKPSHQNLIRLYFQTEAYAGEYDVVKCPEGTPAEDCVQEITAHWQVQDMVKPCDVRVSPHCTGDTVGASGINLIYAGGHCHAPSCISLELYDADSGQLLCRQEPVFGNGTEIYNEEGYIAIPPCLWGPEEEGLEKPTFLPWNANLTSIKLNNNTYTHYGEMASWQMRGVVV